MIAALCGQCFHRLDMRVAFRRLHTETEKETCLCCGRRRYTGLYEANYFKLGRAIRNVKHEDQVQKAQMRERIFEVDRSRGPDDHRRKKRARARAGGRKCGVSR